MNEPQTQAQNNAPDQQDQEFDYSFVSTTGRIAVYDDLKSAPRVTEIEPAETGSYIEKLSSTVYNQARELGGRISYTIIREVSENFIHAQWQEIVVSILDSGNTIRFADHGPGIPVKEKAQMPGFSSAVEPMKSYIRGVGSGLPIVREYLESSNGTITIEDNLGTGAVVTVSLVADPSDISPDEDFIEEDFEDDYPDPLDGFAPAYPLVGGYAPAQPEGIYPQAAPLPGYAQTAVPAAQQASLYAYQQPVSPAQSVVYSQMQPVYPAVGAPMQTGMPAPGAPAAPQNSSFAPALNERDKTFLRLLLQYGMLGNQDLIKLTNTKQATTSNCLKKLDEAGLTRKEGNKRMLTAYGQQVARALG